MKKLIVPAAALTLSLMTVSVGWAQADEPADCGAATATLTSAQRAFDEAKADDDKAAKAKDADEAFDRADRDLRRAQNRLDRAQKAVDFLDDGTTPDPSTPKGTEAERRELESAKKDVRQATDERDRARKQADKENADQLQRVADRTDADALKKAVDEARDDVNRLCGATTTTPTPVPDNDVDCDEVSAAEAQRILDADRSDPNNLDQDKDGTACEVDEILPAPDRNGVTVNNNVAVPSGGVATGGGPAWAFQ